MQKVVGSNPISRFFANALHVGGLVPALKPETKWNHPRISPIFQALMRISAWNGPDAPRLAAIRPISPRYRRKVGPPVRSRSRLATDSLWNDHGVTGRGHLEKRLQRLLNELKDIASRPDFDREDPGRYVRDAAALLERFLKSATLSVPPPGGAGLKALVDALANDGVPADVRDALHAIREGANAAKHDPSAAITALRAEKLLEAALAAVAGLAVSSIPELAAEHVSAYRSQYVLALYDYPAGGEVSASVWLRGAAPSKLHGIATPEAVEEFQFDFQVEAQIEAALAASGEGAFDGFDEPDLWAALRQSSEFAKAWLWEGAHRDLLDAFVSHQGGNDLLPGLARGDHSASVVSACAIAITELAEPISWKDVLWKISTELGVSRQGTAAQVFAKQVTSAVVARRGTEPLCGPRWALNADVAARAADTGFDAGGLQFAITMEGEVWVGLDPQPLGVTVKLMEEEDLRRPSDPLA